MIALIMAMDVVVSARSVDREVQAELDRDARTIRALLMATRRVYHRQFVASGLPVDEKTVGFLPAHALSRIAADFPNWIDTRLRFNNVSDRPRNPANQANVDELAAMQWFRANPSASDRMTEIDAPEGNFFHFSAPIWIEPYCLGCHGAKESAPSSVQGTYAQAYDYQVGDLRGIMSIKLPSAELRAHAQSAWVQRFGARVGGYAVLLILLGVMLQRLVVHRVGRLQQVTQLLRQGDLTARAPVLGQDEITDLSRSFNDMATALALQHAQVQRLNQIYSALSETNQTIVRVKDETVLRERVCQIAVEYGGMALAWLGQSDPSGERLVVAHSFGPMQTYVDGLSIPLDPAVAEGQGPSAVAWRESAPVVVQDYFSDARTRPWHEVSRPYGWGACAAIPILRGGSVHWVFNLYHLEKAAFDDRMLNLLLEMATDIGYALDQMDMRHERERQNNALRISEAKYRNVVATSQDGFWRVDAQGFLLEVNAAYVSFSGYTREELLGKNIAELDADETGQQVAAKLQRIVSDGHALFETHHRTKSGEIRAVEVSATASNAGDAGEPATFSVFTRDLSLRNAAEDRIQRLSHFDTLTGLPNRSLFADMVRQAIGQVQRKGEALSLMLMDVDHFKNINDTLGHRIGDLLLIELAKNFAGALRTEDILSRLGGDEFLLLLPHANAQDAARVAAKLITSISHAMAVDGHELQVSVSMGIALYPGDGFDFETLLQRADTAANRAKLDGRNVYRFFTPEMQQNTTRSLQLETALRRALERKELLLHYQPQVELSSGNIVGLEALVRWQHPQLGLISPAEFIPLAENTGLILPIGAWVLHTALAQLKRWRDAGYQVGQMAVNLSAHQFRMQNLAGIVSGILSEVGLPPSCLELELTESVAMADPASAVETMLSLHRQGVRIAIDDFGTGYSSLNYLRRFPIDRLKIDQSFVRELGSSAEDQAIVQAIISLARTLGYRTIAEGVEQTGQLDFLRESQCDEVQGYLLSRPIPANELEAFLQRWEPARIRR